MWCYFCLIVDYFPSIFFFSNIFQLSITYFTQFKETVLLFRHLIKTDYSFPQLTTKNGWMNLHSALKYSAFDWFEYGSTRAKNNLYVISFKLFRENGTFQRYHSSFFSVNVKICRRKKQMEIIDLLQEHRIKK